MKFKWNSNPPFVPPLFFHQVLIEIIDASSVITWDFDMCKGDVVFNIYHSKRAPQAPRKDPHGITSPGGNNVQLIDKSWTLGQDYSMVESPLTCKEGESVQVSYSAHRGPDCTGAAVALSEPSVPQGSHITRWPGFYILQWKFHNMPACSATNLPRVDDVLATLQVSSHKCKVMYYTEVLGSEDFRSVALGREVCVSTRWFMFGVRASSVSPSGLLPVEVMLEVRDTGEHHSCPRPRGFR